MVNQLPVIQYSLNHMKEIIQSLNLPKQILDKTEELLKTLFGPATKELGELFADSMRYRRIRNQVNIFTKTVQLLEQNNLKARELNLKTIVPLLEGCSLEEDDFLQEKWANLLVNITVSPENGLESKLIKTLSNLNSYEAQILDFSFEEMHKNRLHEYEKKKSWGRLFDKITLEEIKIEDTVVKFKSVKERFKIADHFVFIYIDNLVLLGLFKYEEPEIKVENQSTTGEIVEDEEDEKKVEFELDVTANYSQSNNFKITTYGRYFIEQCKSPKK